MTLPPLTVIEASAGTGKTFALVTRLLQLIFAGTAPERIVALTFSRLAAGEIFNSFIERLSRAALDETLASQEGSRLGLTLSRRDFIAKLREVIAHQHLSLIGTLDSFMMRVVRAIPLELGLGGEVAVMSEYRSPVEQLHLLGDMLMRDSDEAKDVFRLAFRLTLGVEGAKGFLEKFDRFVRDWHLKYRDLPDVAAWGDANRIWGDATPPPATTLSEIRSLADELAPLAGKRGADTFIRNVRTFGGKLPTLPKALQDDATATRAMERMSNWILDKSLNATRGIYYLMSAYEAAYVTKIRARGYVTFDDMPRLLNSLPADVRLPLEYRMDAAFDHWALDEFQDTSREQWKALQGLIAEAGMAESDRSVFIVGDRKQSIYEWRGGDVEILGRMVELAKTPPNRLEHLDESYRYVPVIAEAVNRVFGEEVIRGVMDMDTAPEGAKWKCRPHCSHDASAIGFVEVVQATKCGKIAVMSDFFEPVKNALLAVRPWQRGISSAILVRKNEMGEQLLGYLKSSGLTQVVFEGESDIFDSPVLSAMTELVHLSEHSADEFSYAHILHSPLAAAMYPKGLPGRTELAAQLLNDFTRLGMVRMFRQVREKLKAVPNSWNSFTESRFADFIKCAAEFEQLHDSTMRLSDFEDFVRRQRRRDFAEPGMVRIMTMHRAKGLGFDWVIMPCYEHDDLSNNLHAGPIKSKHPAWILDNPGAAVSERYPVLAVAERTRRQVQTYNSLCLYYVAMTRAKMALTLILHPLSAKPPASPERFSDLVRLVGLTTAGTPSWYTKLSPAPAAAPIVSPPPPAALVRRPRQTLRKSRPSDSFYSLYTADRLFELDFDAAAQRGTDLHVQFAEIEWIDPSSPRNDLERRILAGPWREAFVKPSADATVWREREYELLTGTTWESGQFDRVVFTKVSGKLTATIYDFKTGSNLRPQDYASQMQSYSRALSAMTKIPWSQIATKLLLDGSRMEII